MNRPKAFVRWLRVVMGFLIVLTTGAEVRASEVIPPRPTRYFNDYAHVCVSPTGMDNLVLETEDMLNSNQILVVVYPKKLSDAPVEDYCRRVADAWHVGLKGRDNGAVLFYFVQEKTVYLAVRAGLRHVLPESRCQEIIDGIILPKIRADKVQRGLSDGIQAIKAATADAGYEGTFQPKYLSWWRYLGFWDWVRRIFWISVAALVGWLVWACARYLYKHRNDPASRATHYSSSGSGWGIVSGIFAVASFGASIGGGSSRSGGWSSGGGDSGAGGGASGSW